MTLDSMVKMAQADRYTEDGRQIVNDVRRIYKIGEKSETTGKIKTANGWRNPTKQEAAAESKEDKLNKIRTVHSSEKLGNGQTIELTESKKNGNFYVKIDGQAMSAYRSKEAAQKEYDAFKRGEDPVTERGNKLLSSYNEKHPESPMELKTPRNYKDPAAGPQRDISAENRAYHERVEKERAERKASAQQSAQTAAQEAKQKGYTGETLKDFMLSKTYEGASVSVTQRGMEAQGWSLTKGEDGLNVYEKPDGSKVTMQLEGNKVKSAEYQPAGSTKMSAPKNAGRGDMLKIGTQSVRIERAVEGRYGNELGTLLQYTDPETKKNKYALQSKNGEMKDVTKEIMSGAYDAAPIIEAQSVNAPGDSFKKKLTGDCKVKLSKIKR